MANVKISALSAGTTLTGTEQFEAVQGGVSVKLTAAQNKTYSNRLSISYRSVANAFTETVGNSDDVVIFYNAGAIATGTITMPAAPLDGQVVRLSFAMTITTLTVSPNAGQSILGAPTTATVSTGYAFVYRSANTTWYRMG